MDDSWWTNCDGYALWLGSNGQPDWSCTWDTSEMDTFLTNMQGWGCNIIRIPLTVAYWDDNTNNFQADLEAFITQAGSMGMYVEVSFWDITGVDSEPNGMLPWNVGGNGYLTSQSDFVNLWANVTGTLKGYNNVLFELWNEPNGADNNPTDNSTDQVAWMQTSQLCLNAIRANGCTNIVVTQWGYGVADEAGNTYDMSWITNNPLNDTTGNLVYSTHLYRQYFLDGGSNEIYAMSDITTDYTACGLFSLNAPLLIGEIGCDSSAADLINEQTWFNNSLTLLNQHGISYLGWAAPPNDDPWDLTYGNGTNYATGYAPNIPGQMLINAILAGLPHGPKPNAPVINPIAPNPSTTGNVTLTWNAVTGATNYNVYHSASNITSITGLTPIGSPTVNSYLDILTANGTEFYVVTAVNRSGVSGMSNCVNVTVAVPPTSPPVLNVISPNPSTTGNINITWNSVSGAVRYMVYRNTSVITTNIGLIPRQYPTVTTYNETIITNGVYYYAIIALNQSWELSPMSNDESVNVSIPPPPVPASPSLNTITPSPSTSGNITLTWNSVTGAVSYNVYRDTSNITSVGMLTPIGSPTGTTYQDTLALNGTYYYAITAMNGSGESPISNCESILVAIPSIPANTTSTTTSSTTNSTTNTSTNNSSKPSSSNIASYPLDLFVIMSAIGIAALLMIMKKKRSTYFL